MRLNSTAKIEENVDDQGNRGYEVEGYDIDMSLMLPDAPECRHCGEPVAEYDEWVHDATGNRWCDDLTDEEAAERHEEAGAYDEDSTGGPTRAEPSEYLPGNWIGMSTDIDGESVSVQISVGDPRGCMEFTLRRWTDPDTGKRVLLLHMPDINDATPHATMTELHPGTYRIG